MTASDACLTLSPLADVPGLSGLALTLHAPRANALEPGVLQQISAALQEVERAVPDVLLIQAGRNFCSGGDVARFHQAVMAGRGRAYAQEVVPVLQDIVYRLAALPAVVAVAARGAVTGGGAGLLFAADLAVLHPDAFVQPYYSKVGFAPDGGWSALLPERIGAGSTLAWLAADRRAGAEELCQLGLAAAVDAEPEHALRGLLVGQTPGSLRAAKSLVWDAPRLAQLRARLDAETAAFLDRIECATTLAGMQAFLSPS